MMCLGSIVILGWLLMRGAPLPGLLLVAAGVAVQVILAVRLGLASMGGVGGHAEWIRDVEERPRIMESRAWAIGVGLVVLGLAVALVP